MDPALRSRGPELDPGFRERSRLRRTDGPVVWRGDDDGGSRAGEAERADETMRSRERGEEAEAPSFERPERTG
jgi:hypothetical protein